MCFPVTSKHLKVQMEQFVFHLFLQSLPRDAMLFWTFSVTVEGPEQPKKLNFGPYLRPFGAPTADDSLPDEHGWVPITE